MATKHIPIRTCIATGVKLPKNEMIRLVRTEAGEVVVDLKGKIRGRGANLAMNAEAFDLAVKKRAISRSLKLEKPLTPEELERLRTEFVNAIEQREFRQGNKPVVVRVTREELDKAESQD